jgi:hypothetical protein
MILHQKVINGKELSPQTKIWRLLVFAPFLIIIKSPNEVWRLIVSAPFRIIIIIIIIIIIKFPSAFTK